MPKLRVAYAGVMPMWRIALTVADVILAAAFIALEVVVIRTWKKKSKTV